MRIWSLHPQYLDRQGLLGVWRESLLAQKVLKGGTRGYRAHPQLDRFRGSTDPVTAIATYLHFIAMEGEKRGYNFDRLKIESGRLVEQIPVTSGQILYEWDRLKSKLLHRDPEWLLQFSNLMMPEVHPLFKMIPGGLEPWEKSN
jgi:hypothetical protein